MRKGTLPVGLLACVFALTPLLPARFTLTDFTVNLSGRWLPSSTAGLALMAAFGESLSSRL